MNNVVCIRVQKQRFRTPLEEKAVIRVQKGRFCTPLEKKVRPEQSEQKHYINIKYFIILL